MEQRQPSVETMPNLPPASPELPMAQGPEIAAPSPEITSDRRNEATERRIGQQVESLSAPPVQLPTLPTPVNDVTSGAQVQQPVVSTTPIAAADEDLIEKEWVTKVKEVIAATKDDPYRREQEVKKLQIDYVRKRYGREIGESND